ncbi:unnamed protein product [Linum tenue]|uniref:RNase H type-1 domain-containing protein n=1 Tax=Linum tenue TaxID=586396 RepID=A0AAV0L721_9ROSI|nr:unnamed protein product [Linum tenue]
MTWPDQLVRRARLFSEQCEEGFEKRNSVAEGGRSVEQHWVSWQRPPTGWVGLNTDGSVVLAQGRSAAGGVIRDSEGRFLVAYSTNLGGGSITNAELAGIAQGLQLAWERGYRKVAVQTDSSTAISLIHSAETAHPHYTLVAYIRRLMEREWEVSLSHVFRESNFVADHLASVGHSLAIGTHMVDFPGAELRYWLYFDTLGVQTPRFIAI